jgi:hypothetical protein
MKETLTSSETSVLTRATRRNIPEDAIFHSHRRENLKSYIPKIQFWFVTTGSSTRTDYFYDMRPNREEGRPISLSTVPLVMYAVALLVKTFPPYMEPGCPSPYWNEPVIMTFWEPVECNQYTDTKLHCGQSQLLLSQPQTIIPNRYIIAIVTNTTQEEDMLNSLMVRITERYAEEWRSFFSSTENVFYRQCIYPLRKEPIPLRRYIRLERQSRTCLSEMRFPVAITDFFSKQWYINIHSASSKSSTLVIILSDCLMFQVE